ncbi:MAG: putative Ig domain-containing protein, partial [Oscillatoria sp. PMC 1051.18]|nr:putative Ig domain-containing protein [Oscillatoria sp. PMC 1050.18]MEC5033323.1 putative Ig domain-containing protein [Oscillatoria sp. PMC 1051.18]
PGTEYGLNQEVYQYRVEALDPDNDTLTYRLVDAPLGALIDSETGELLWFPETTVGLNSYDFTVEVADGRGGFDLQSFSVNVSEVTGSIRGGVFDDLNNNGYRDTSLVLGDSPNLVFAIDVSGSAGYRTIDWTTTEIQTVFNQPTSILDRELATVAALNNQLIATGRGNDTNVSIILFNHDAWIHDLDPTTAGIQTYTTPLADNNHNGILDLIEALNINSPQGGTYFTPPLQTAQSLLQSLPSGDPNLIFLSDGYGGLETEVVDELRSAGVNITAFGIGQGAGMEQLRLIDPDAIQVTALEEIVNIFSGRDERYALEPLLENVTVYLDLNNNSQLDLDEPWQSTQPDDTPSLLENQPFQFSFDNLLPGSYTLRQIVPNGYSQTAPVEDAFLGTITLNGENLTYLFGNHRLSEPANQNPVFISNPPTDTLLVDDTLRYLVRATDADADALTYSLSLAPSGAVIDPETGYLVWHPTPEQVGTANLMVKVSDDRGGFELQYFQLEVAYPNRSPVFTSSLPTSQQIQQGKPFTYQARAIDADQDTITYELIDAPDNLTLNPNTGLVSWTPEELGDVEFTLKARDGKGGEALQNLSLSVIEAQPNTTPVIVIDSQPTTGEISINPRSQTRIGNPYLYQLPTTDNDGDTLTYTLTTAPTGMSLSSDSLITWTPTTDQIGAQTVAVEFTDGQGGIGTVAWTINVSHQEINLPPQILSVPTLVTNLEKPYHHPSIGYDPNGDFLLWNLTTAPVGMVIDPQNGTITWQPTPNSIGTHQVTIQLSDHLGATTTQEFTLEVRGINTPPQIHSTPITSVGVTQAYTYQIAATDIDNDALTYTLTSAPDNLTINQLGQISWTPQLSQIGNHEITVMVSDTVGATTTQTYNLIVQSTPINH